MKHALLLAWRHLTHHRGRSAVLGCCVALTALFPLAVQALVDAFSSATMHRAQTTPLVLGVKGSRYDLVLSSLYFRGRVPEASTMAAAAAVDDTGLGRAIPLHCGNRARGAPLVGTTPEYFRFRGLRPARGTLPLMLGDAVLGADIAAATGLGPGDSILSEQDNLYDISKGYPLRMRVAGVLERSGGPDDDAVFADLKTTWIVDGIGHGHEDAAASDDDQVLKRTEDGVILNASVREYQEITEANIDGFHFHAEDDELPVTGILVVPRDRKATALLKGRYAVAETQQLLVPVDVVAEIQGFVFRLKAFFDANTAAVGLATALFLGLVVLLSVRVRTREIETLTKIGFARRTIALVFALEFALVVTAGLVCAILLAWLFVTTAPLESWLAT